MKNIVEAVQKALAHCGTQIRKDRKTAETTPVMEPVEPPSSPVTSDGRPYSAHQTERYERYQQVMVLRNQGVKVKEIAKCVGLGVRTVQGWVTQGGYVETNYHHKHHSRYEAYAAYVQKRWDEGCHNIQQLWREIKTQGYLHSAQALRKQLGAQQGKKKASLPPTSTADRFEAKTAVWLFIRPITDLDKQERAELETLRQASETVETIYQLVQEFLRMVRKRKGLQLENWLAKVRASPIPELHRFAKGIERDKSAVLAGLTLSYSNGQTVSWRRQHSSKFSLQDRSNGLMKHICY